MAEAIGPGTPLICVNFYWPLGLDTPSCFNNVSLTVKALYFCEWVGADEPDGSWCPWDDCQGHMIYIKGKTCDHGNFIPYCPNLFRPFNEGNEALTRKGFFEDVKKILELAK